MDYNGEYIDSAGDIIPFDFKPKKCCSGKTIDYIKHNEINRDAFSMSACFFKKQDFIKNYGLNSNYFYYFEDIDFSIRIRRNN